MSLLTVIIAVSVLGAVAYSALYLVEFIRKDGYDRLGGTRQPPQSHQPDHFDPRYHTGLGPTRTA